jgi:hypothetical protein
MSHGLFQLLATLTANALILNDLWHKRFGSSLFCLKVARPLLAIVGLCEIEMVVSGQRYRFAVARFGAISGLRLIR